MKSFKLAYKITETASWRNKNGIDIKSNLADDELVECQLAKSLVEALKEDSAVLEADKLVLAIAEAQKRDIETSFESMDDMAIQAKAHADKAHEVLSTIAEDTEEKYLALEEKFSSTEKRFNNSIKATAESIKESMEKLSTVEEKLSAINNYSLDKLTSTLDKLIRLAEQDPKLVELVLNHKNAER